MKYCEHVNDMINNTNVQSCNVKSKIEEVECIKTITEHIYSVFFLLLLKDKRLTSCSYDNTIRIFDPSNDYHCNQVIYYNSEGILSICELEDGTIVSCSQDKSRIIGDYTIHNAHDNGISKVIALPNNRIASCSWDNTIKIWKSNPPYCDTPLIVLKGHSHWVNSILYLKEKDIMISGSNDNALRLWNMSTYQCITVIEGVECYWTNSLYQIKKIELLLVDMINFI